MTTGYIYPDFSEIKIIATDVDGVLTDGGMYYFENGNEAKKFNTKDGMAVELLKEKGIHVVFITKESTLIAMNRANKLGIEIFQPVEDKGLLLLQIMKETNVTSHEIAYIGDDVNDISALRNAGIAICPADAVNAVKKICQVITNAKGGDGVLREVYERFIV